MSHHDADGIKYPGIYEGVVADNADPKNLYRCRLTVPGKMKLSTWAFPMGTIGGGSPQRGGHVVPAIGADVGVMFMNGNPEKPVYFAANWGIPDAGSEMPQAAIDAGADAHQVQAFQFGPLAITFDERPGKRKFTIQDLETQDHISWDLEEKGLHVKMTSAIVIEADGLVKVDGTQIQIQNRFVRVTQSPV